MAQERELVRLARSGDVQAFESLYRSYNDRIYNFAKQITESPDDAADVTQDAFIRAWRALPELRSDGLFGVWLHRIVLNGCRDLIKKKGRKPTVSFEEIETSDNFESRAPIPERAVLADEKHDAVRQAIRSLNEGHRLVVTMHHLEGMNVDSISKVLRIPRGTVMSRLSRARETLKRKLAPYVEGGRDEQDK